MLPLWPCGFSSSKTTTMRKTGERRDAEARHQYGSGFWNGYRVAAPPAGEAAEGGSDPSSRVAPPTADCAACTTRKELPRPAAMGLQSEPEPVR
jgi:hypothetical protein